MKEQEDVQNRPFLPRTESYVGLRLQGSSEGRQPFLGSVSVLRKQPFLPPSGTETPKPVPVTHTRVWTAKDVEPVLKRLPRSPGPHPLSRCCGLELRPSSLLPTFCL